MIDSFAKFDYIKNPELCWASPRFYVQGKALYYMFRFTASNVLYPGICQYIPIYMCTYVFRTPDSWGGFQTRMKGESNSPRSEVPST